MIEKLKNFFNRELMLTDDEKVVKEVVEKMLAHKDTKFQIAPMSQDIILLNRPKEYYIFVNSAKIKISNHKFCLEKSFRVSFLEDIKRLIFDKMEKDRQDLIKELFANEINLLQGISENLN